MLLHYMAQVRAVAAVKLAFTGNEGDVAAVMPLARAFTGAVAVTCKMGPCLSHNRATAALLRHAADTWPYITSVTLELTWTHPQAYVWVSLCRTPAYTAWMLLRRNQSVHTAVALPCGWCFLYALGVIYSRRHRL